MQDGCNGLSRRKFITATALACTSALVPSRAFGRPFERENLQVWSCGGLAEAFVPANKYYEEMTGCNLAYTGAFAAALGKSLLANATTEVFGPRVLDLAKKLKAQGKMLNFRPLCFTRYVLITPKGNPAGIEGVEDLARPGVRVLLSPDSSPPGGKATMVVLKKAGVLEGAQKNAIRLGDCVQREVAIVASGKADVSVVEYRIAKLPQFRGKFDVIDIPERFFPPPPIPFTIGIMKWAKNMELAEDFVKFITSEKGQSFFERAGFIPALSEEGERLTKKYGVKDA
ncbi:MAG: substrate-binding domain-containing protein [Desulfobacteria bacterium]